MEHVICNSPACRVELAIRAEAKSQAKQAKAERKNDLARREKLKTRSDYIKEAQIAFNNFIRQRDIGKTCICCDKPLSGGATGGSYDCGHYRSVGSAPHLRFDERNAHGQTKQCNRYGAGRAVDYRKGLILRIGREAVDCLENDDVYRKFTIEDLKYIIVTYRAKLKSLQSNKT
jgi:hypothetical protein